MNEVEFTAEDFEDLAFIEEFNKEHWKGERTDFEWHYDVDRKDPKIIEIRNSLTQIRNKLETIRSYFAEKDDYKPLNSDVQKMTAGITKKYLPHIWITFTKGLERRQQSEPQLQITIRSQDINISLWFENASANRKYLSSFLENYAEDLKKDSRLEIEVYESGLEGKCLNVFKIEEWDKFNDQITDLDFDCKVGFSYIIPKDEVLKRGKNIIETIEENLGKMKINFDNATLVGDRFLIVNIEWNDFGWTQPQIPDKPSFGYAKDGNMPHDTLNFKFDKPVDSAERVYGYFQPPRGNPPREFVKCTSEHKTIFFHSRNRIVGIYGDAEYIENVKEYEHREFEDNKHLSNISGKRDLSFGFIREAYLDSIPEYMNNKQMRRSTFIYIPMSSARRIIQDAVKKYEAIIKEDTQNRVAKDHLNKLENILKTISASVRIFRKSESEFFNLLSNKKQVILYGPPGTGKTYRTKDLAVKFLKSD